MTVEVLTLDDRVLDEIRVISTGPPQGEFTPVWEIEPYSAGGRMRGAFKGLGAAVSAYIDDRWTCAR